MVTNTAIQTQMGWRKAIALAAETALRARDVHDIYETTSPALPPPERGKLARGIRPRGAIFLFFAVRYCPR